MPVIELANALATVAVVWFGGMLVMAGDPDVTLGVLVAFLTYVTRFFQPLRKLTQFYNQLQSAMAGAEKVFELMDEPVTLDERPNAITPAAVRGDVEFQHVGFSYGARPVLNDVSFDDPGRDHDRAGRAHRRGQDDHLRAARPLLRSRRGRRAPGRSRSARSLVRSAARKSIAVVLQDNFLFSGTIADNIRYGKPDATDDEIMEAARLAHAHEFIERFPNGYQTSVMERAANLSLGQRQLIAIARAVLADPRVLILDEATSNVDPRTEVLLQAALQRLLAGRTSLVVAHRLSTIHAADQVLVIDGGEIVERGRHEELLSQRGAYYRLHQQQFAPTETADEAAPTTA